MDNDLIILLESLVILWLGILNWRLASKLHTAEEQSDIQHNLILSMAKELSGLGSPNVAVSEVVPAYNIKYGKE